MTGSDLTGNSVFAFSTGTTVLYDVVFSSNVDNADVIHQALDYLITQGYMIDFNDTQIADKLMIAYPGVFTNGGELHSHHLTSASLSNEMDIYLSHWFVLSKPLGIVFYSVM